MVDREKVIKGLECCICGFSKCKSCPYHNDMGSFCVTQGLAPDALELLKHEQSTSTEDTAYQRLMEIYRDLIERNTKLEEEAQKLAQFNDHLTALCEALMKKVYSDERS